MPIVTSCLDRDVPPHEHAAGYVPGHARKTEDRITIVFLQDQGGTIKQETILVCPTQEQGFLEEIPHTELKRAYLLPRPSRT